jgi:hypothetical protein
VTFEYTNYFCVVSSGAAVAPLRITVEISSHDNGCPAEPATMFHEASVNLTDVIVRTLSPDWTRPDRQQVEIHRPLNARRTIHFPKTASLLEV